MRNKTRTSNMDRRPKAPIGNSRKQKQNSEREQTTQSANIVEPLSHVDAANIEQSNRGQPETGKANVVKGIRAEAMGAQAKSKECGGSAKVEHACEIRKIAHPISPGANEAGEIAERLAGPHIDAALFGIARREFHNAGGQRNEEASKRGNPDDQNAWAGGRGGCYPAHAEDNYHVEQHQVAKPDASFERWNLIHVRAAYQSRARWCS